MSLFGLLCVGLGIAVLWPELPIGKQIRALLIEAPAHLLSKLTWAKIIATAALTAFFVGALMLAFNVQDGVIVFMALPDILAWLAAFDIATTLELSIVVAFAAASIRVGAFAQFVVARGSPSCGCRSWRVLRSRHVRVARNRIDRRVARLMTMRLPGALLSLKSAYDFGIRGHALWPRAGVIA